jgi:hypothetical protein
MTTDLVGTIPGGALQSHSIMDSSQIGVHKRRGVVKPDNLFRLKIVLRFLRYHAGFFLIVLALPSVVAGQSTLPSPQDVLGFYPGQDHHLAGYQDILDYFSRLDRSSDRLQLDTLGLTHKGRPLVLAVISSGDNLERLESIRQHHASLYDPDPMTVGRAKRAIQNEKSIISINCSLHPREVGPSQLSMELAYRLLTEESGMFDRIRRDVITLLIPSHNPDGLDRIVQWYYRHKGSVYADGPYPFLDHPYTGHDINRDWFLLTQPETRLTVESVYNRWHPHVVVDLHQMGRYGPRMFVPPYVDPYDDQMDPILQAELTSLGSSVAADLTSQYKRGVLIHGCFDAYSPARAYCHYHYGARLLIELASGNAADPVLLQKQDLRPFCGIDPRYRQWNLPLPWIEGTWGLSHIVEYGLNACFSVLKHAAVNRLQWATNTVRMVHYDTQEIPERPLYLIPPGQHDSHAVHDLLTILDRGEIKLYRATDDFVLGETLYPKDMIVIPAAQPFGRYAQTLLFNRPYPASGNMDPNAEPTAYDVTSHHLPSFFGVTVLPVYDRFSGPFERIHDLRPPEGRYPGNTGLTNGVVVDYRSNAAVRLLFESLYDLSAFWLMDSIDTGSQTLDCGSLWIPLDDTSRVGDLARKSGVDFYAAPPRENVRVLKLYPPRIGLYSGYPASIDVGWTRFLFDSYSVPYELVDDSMIRNQELPFDVLIVTDQDAESVVQGAKPSQMPTPYCGGIGYVGVDRLKAFVKSGGTLVLLNRSVELASRYMHVDSLMILQDGRAQEYYSPGALLRARIQTDHPLGYGLQREIAGLNRHSPLLLAHPGQSVARYTRENVLKSGWIRGRQLLTGRSVMADMHLGKGRLILIAVRPQFRAQTRASYKLLFNALIRSRSEPMRLDHFRLPD